MTSVEEKPLTTPGELSPSKTSKVRDSEEANNAKINARMKMI
jgi:hypothetical protein